MISLLRVLFFEGFAHEKSERSEATKRLLGDIPYLNGGLFVEHHIEETYGDSITIPDAAFAKLFEFFGSWRWHLSERPGVSDREIDPDVLGYIFEKYINQKQMGAYYTKEDITGYICRNTIIPALFDKANLSISPLALPKNIGAYLYLALKQVDRLPTETDREYAARQARVQQLIADAQAGAIATVNDAITANLNLEAMIFDLVPFLDAQPLHRLYLALAGLSILDPTCGSGAFLFAAIKILKPIYEQILERMALLVERRKAEGMPFSEILKAEQAHANRDYFITKSIVVRNLYGVDLMEEATEICKLRLFLRLVADLEDAAHVEPLPDIDFNIRAGNALVGYASVEEIGGGYKGGIAALPKRVQQTVQEVEAVQRELSVYRTSQLQLNPSSDVFRSTRQSIRDKIGELNKALDADMLKMGQIHAEPGGGYNTQPFHWFTAFYEILSNGGFDVIVGNPPYVEYSKVRGDKKKDGEDRYKIYCYKTEDCGNLYAYVMERSLSLMKRNGKIGMIVPMSGHSTERMQPLITNFYRHAKQLYIMNISADANPSVLFPGVKFRLAVFLFLQKAENQKVYTTRYTKWFADERTGLFERIDFTQIVSEIEGVLPKISNPIHRNILQKITRKQGQITSENGKHTIYYHNAPVSWLRAHPFVPYFHSERDGQKASTQLKPLNFKSQERAYAAAGIISSSIFYLWWVSISDCYHLNKREVEGFPIDFTEATLIKRLAEISIRLMEDLKAKSHRRVYTYATSGRVEYDEFYPKQSKSIIDEIDRVLAQHYSFTDEELDFIINYDIKYRMGRDATTEDADVKEIV